MRWTVVSGLLSVWSASGVVGRESTARVVPPAGTVARYGGGSVVEREKRAKGVPLWSTTQNVTRLFPGAQMGSAQQLMIQVVFRSGAETG